MYDRICVQEKNLSGIWSKWGRFGGTLGFFIQRLTCHDKEVPRWISDDHWLNHPGSKRQAWPVLKGFRVKEERCFSALCRETTCLDPPPYSIKALLKVWHSWKRVHGWHLAAFSKLLYNGAMHQFLTVYTWTAKYEWVYDAPQEDGFFYWCYGYGHRQSFRGSKSPKQI